MSFYPPNLIGSVAKEAAVTSSNLERTPPCYRPPCYRRVTAVLQKNTAVLQATFLDAWIPPQTLRTDNFYTTSQPSS